jgi:putative spermidine/putrescine transport system substrate-binding protein
MRMNFQSIDRGESVLPSTLLEESYLPESDAAYVTWMKEQWFNEVVQK